MSNKRRILKFALGGAGICAFILFFFGDGFAMAFYLAGEGAIMGFIVGGAVSVLRVLLLRASVGSAICRKPDRTSHTYFTADVLNKWRFRC